MSSVSSNHFAIRPATMDDVEAVTALYNTWAISRVGHAQHEVDDFRGEWGSASFDLSTDTRVVLTPGGEYVGYCELWDVAPHVRLDSFVCVHPEYEGRGIGTLLGGWLEERARQAIPKAPKGTQVLLLQELYSTDAAGCALLEQQGYRAVRYSLRMVAGLEAPSPEPQLPEGILIRPYRQEQELRALVLAVRDAFQDHWGYVAPPIEEDYAEWQHWIATDPHYDASLWFVAVDGQEIAGAATCRSTTVEDPEMGAIYNFSVRRPWRRRGVGLALLHHSMGELYRRGVRRVGLGVDADSLTGATRLYEKVGMRVVRQNIHYGKELRPGKELGAQTV